MPDVTTPTRFNWRMHPRPTPRPDEPMPHDAVDCAEYLAWNMTFQGARHDPSKPLFEPGRAFDPTVAPWADHDPLAYVDGMNHYIVEGDNPINAVNPLGT
jgi:RHS repeat-associated protein